MKPRARAALSLLSTIILLLAPAHAHASEATDRVVSEAMKSSLQTGPGWLALGHYTHSLTGGYQSSVDDPAFFLSPGGMTSPAMELEATIRALLEGPASMGDGHPACRFPARLEWLRENHAFADDDLPSPECGELGSFMNKLSPVSAALVFPESHINSPASMFGHTLLRIDSRRESKLMSYSVSYAAELPEDPGYLYALRGVMGGYKGAFSIKPYYERIKEYSHMESRDIWEYGLGLTPGEVRRLALHIWEMKDIRPDYYFFDENCSKAPLELIEAIRPGLGLTEEFFYWVMPTDTIRALRDNGLVNSVSYRPSKASRIAMLEALAPESAIEKAMKAGGIKTGAPETQAPEAMDGEDSALALDLAAEYTMHQYMTGALDPEAYRSRYLGILSDRSALPAREYAIAEPDPPETGHGTARITLGGGRLGDSDYALLGLRLAYHGLPDPPGGYRPGSAIEILGAEVRQYEDTDETVLVDLTLVEITSLWRPGALIRPLSWHMRLGAGREYAPLGERTPVVLEGGKGLAVGAGRSGILWAIIEPSLKAGGGLEDGYSLGGGVYAGALLDVRGYYGLLIRGRAFYYSEGERHSQRSIGLTQTLRLTRDLSLAIDYKRSSVDGLYMSDSSLRLNLYF